MILDAFILLGAVLIFLFCGRVVLDVNNYWPASPVARRRWILMTMGAVLMVVVPAIIIVLEDCK